MSKLIIDEFTDLPVSKQRKRQLRARRDGKCISCGKPVCEKSKQFCTYHLNYRRSWEKQLRHDGIYLTPAMVENRTKLKQLVDNFRKDLEKWFDEIYPA